MKYNNTDSDILKAFKRVRALEREKEIKMFGKQISFRRTITKNKRKYNRKEKHPQYNADVFCNVHFTILSFY